MWIKICGNTNLADARLAAEGGADAVGFVFAESPRRVTASEVRRITAELPAQVETYGVFVESDFDQIVSVVAACGLTGVQIHRSPDRQLPLRLREHFAGLSRRVAIIQALHLPATRQAGPEAGPTEGFDRELAECCQNGAIDGVLVDARTAKAVGGTGACFDWAAARPSFLRAAPRLRLIAAGGLSPGNVRQAIETLRPWGVDTVSGVEMAPGKKDGARVLAFIRAARAAAADEIRSLADASLR